MCEHPLQLRREWIEDLYEPKTVAWIDFCSLASCPECSKSHPTPLEDGEVEASYNVLAERWRTKRTTVQTWINDWMKQGRIVRLSQPSVTGRPASYQILEYSENKLPSLLYT